MKQRPKLIGLYSPAPQSGKTTVAQYLNHQGYIRLSFAAPLKRMIRTFLLSLGYGPEAIEEYLTTGKEDQIPGIRATPRHLLQTLGTEWGRTCIHPCVWLLCWQETANRYLKADIPVVCDDVRFPNEAELIRSLGGEVWQITRPSATTDTTHASEGALDTFTFDTEIGNTGSLSDLQSLIYQHLWHPESL